MDETDENLIRLCLGDHPDAFRHLVDRYEVPLLRHLAARLGGRDEADEAAQEAMVRAYFALPKLRDPGAFFPWLCGISDRVAMEALRRRRRDASIAQEVAKDVVTNEAPAWAGSAGGELGRAIADLPEPLRQAILMRFYGQHSCADISKHLGVSLGTVTSRLSRAYALLRRQLGEAVEGRIHHDMF